MDWIIFGVIIVAIAGAVRLIKDRIDKKPFNRPLFYIELLLICLALFGGVFGRKSQVQHDADKDDTLKSRFNNLSLHSDTSLNVVKDEIIQSDSLKINTLGKMVDSLKTENNIKDDIIVKSRKPNLDIKELNRQYNPLIIQLVKGGVSPTGLDSFRIETRLTNYGNAYAKELHIKTLLGEKMGETDIVPLGKQSGTTSLNRFQNLIPGETEVLESGLILQDNFTSVDTFYLGVIYSYKDSLGRSYNDNFRLFKWPNQKITGTPIHTDDETVDHFISAMKKSRLWPSKHV